MTQPLSLTNLVGARVRALRDARGWSARELSERLAERGTTLSRANISDLEVGRRPFITLEELVALADVLGMPVSMFLRDAFDAKAVTVGERTWRPSGRDKVAWRETFTGFAPTRFEITSDDDGVITVRQVDDLAENEAIG